MRGKRTDNDICSRRRLHNLKALANDFGDLLVLMLQLAQRKRDIVPLPLRIAPLQASRQLVCQLPGVFVLDKNNAC